MKTQPATGRLTRNLIYSTKPDYADISQREQLAAALKRWPLLAEFAQQK
ncbi:cellulose biosynthesis protein BcsR [Escherichia coli]